MTLALGQRGAHPLLPRPVKLQRKVTTPSSISWPMASMPLWFRSFSQRRDRLLASPPALITRASSESFPAAAGSTTTSAPTPTPTPTANDALTFRQKLAAAAAARPPRKKKEPLPARLLSSFLATSSVPYSSYVPEPATFLHRVHARAKLLLLLSTLLLAARSPPGARAALASAVAASSVALLPARLALPQLRRVLAIAAFIFVVTAIGAESVPPPLQSRCPPGVEVGLGACPPPIAVVLNGGAGGASGIASASADAFAFAHAAAAAAAAAASSASPSTTAASSQQLSSSFAALAEALSAPSGPAPVVVARVRSYSYVVLHFLFVTVTRRSVRLATSAAATAFLALQGSSLVLTTTPAEEAALALCTLPRLPRMKRWRKRAKKTGRDRTAADDSDVDDDDVVISARPANRTALTLLLSLRFLALVFDEARGLALGLAARGVEWEALSAGGGTFALGLRLVARLFANLQARAGDVAVAMTARGFAGPGKHVVHPAAATEGGGGGGGGRGSRVSFGATAVALCLALAALGRAAASSPA